jgi:fructose-bisphosphate aldolase, class II
MPLVTSKEMLLRAQREGYAVGAFNANNMECVKAVIEAAEEEKAPVILQVSQGAIKYAGLEMATAMVKAAAQRAAVPVALHLDHGTSYDQNVICLVVGFTSLMFDGSAEPLENNIAISAKIAEIGHLVGIPLECELGKIPKVEDYFSPEEIIALQNNPNTAEAVEIVRQKAGAKVESLMADPKQAEEFVKRTGTDALAAAMGSIHGMWDDIWPLRIDRVKEIREATSLPLVLHGSSGVIRTRKDAEARGIKLLPGEGTLEDAVKAGVSKVNVATAVSMAFLRGAKQAFEKRPGERDLRKILQPGLLEAKQLVASYIRLLGASGKAEVTGEASEKSVIMHAE